MGLACSQARLLTLTTRKANCEYGLTVSSMRKMALTREMSELSQEYHSRLQDKQISYYANGKYNKVLICATGALMNPTMMNQKNSLPCIAHIITLEAEV